MDTREQNFAEICAELIKKNSRSVHRANELYIYAKERGVNPDHMMLFVKPLKVSRGVYDLRKFAPDGVNLNETIAVNPRLNSVNENSFQPDIDPEYVETEFYSDIEKIFKSGLFFPTAVTGPTGDGKTITSLQIAARQKSKIVRANITGESDEDSLMGGFRLLNGETVYQDGPVITAMLEGVPLLLDEFDQGNPENMMCLQSVMEGNGYHIKRANRWVKPKDGFMVFATGNTKGTGDASGAYLTAQVQNTAFLDRFSFIRETDYMPAPLEKKVLEKQFNKFGVIDGGRVDHMVTTANMIREGAKSGGGEIESVISTRRLVDMVKACRIWDGDIERAFHVVTSRFDAKHQKAFKNTWDSTRPRGGYSDKAKAKAEKPRTIPNNYSFKNTSPFSS